MKDFLSADQRAQLAELRHRDPFVRDVLQQLDRILLSRRFCRVQQRAKNFLTFVVAKALLGQTDQIKELAIGLVVFGNADFDPLQSSAVRVAAKNLRRLLTDYSKGEGRGDDIELVIPLNTYIPEFLNRKPTLCISEIENWHPQGEQPHLCAAIGAELAYRFERAGMLVWPSESRSLVCSSPCRYTLRGSVESHETRVRLNVSLADRGGWILSSQVAEGPRDELFRITRELAEVLLSALKLQRARRDTLAQRRPQERPELAEDRLPHQDGP